MADGAGWRAGARRRVTPVFLTRRCGNSARDDRDFETIMDPEHTLAIVFADVCGSTQLYEKLGDARARGAVARCIELMTLATERHGGRVVKTIGDEVMSVFPTADQAAQAASEMQASISGGAAIEGRHLAIRVGLHCGPVIVEADGDVYGDAVNLASRMGSQAKAGQVLTTGATASALSAAWGDGVRKVDEAKVKGKRGRIDVYELLWQDEDVTQMGTTPWVSSPARATGRLRLQVGGAVLELNDDQPTATVGRADQNDMMAAGEFVSRLHARIEYRHDSFVLTDQSTNGCYVLTDDGTRSFVRRDSQVLRRGGYIGLGRAPEPGQPDALRYEVLR